MSVNTYTRVTLLWRDGSETWFPIRSQSTGAPVVSAWLVELDYLHLTIRRYAIKEPQQMFIPFHSLTWWKFE